MTATMQMSLSKVNCSLSTSMLMMYVNRLLLELMIVLEVTLVSARDTVKRY